MLRSHHLRWLVRWLSCLMRRDWLCDDSRMRCRNRSRSVSRWARWQRSGFRRQLLP